jgi:lysophospholipid acyltransferase (LPLAT)-like uncharacterized protein
MKFKEVKQGSLRFLGNYFLALFATILCKTLRINFKNVNVIEELDKQKLNYVLAFWHGSMLVSWYIHRRRDLVALISKSKDGDLLSNLLKFWDYNVVRGSSTEGGDIALGILIDYAKNKKSIVITPDGPKGPRHKLKAGAVISAKKGAVPLILMGVGFKHKKYLNSWDKFEIPRPFSETNIVYSDPIYVDKELGYEETSEVIRKSEEVLNNLHNEANRFQ